MSKCCHGRRKSCLENHLLRRMLAAAFLLLAIPWSLAAQEPARWKARAVAGPGERVVAPDLQSTAEKVTLDPSLMPRLLALPVEGSLTVADWPIAPESRRDVVLTRHEVYAPDARILRVDGKGAMGTTEVPRSRLAFYWGTADDDEDVRVFLAVDPESGAIQSFTQSREGLNELRPVPGLDAKAGQHLVAPPAAFLEEAALHGEAPRWSCGEEEVAENARHVDGRTLQSIFGAISAPFTSLHSATVAIDTDNELMLQKFNNDTTAATNYIASLFAAMTVMYERDLHVRLLQGTTLLRVSTTPDPYTQSDPTVADGNELSEFSNYWNANEGSVKRAVAAMLSGKQGSSNTSSGIAWISGLCSTSMGYSFTQVFKINYLAGDALIVGHEIGHNFGSPHTHCYNPPVDNCYNKERSAPSCFTGTDMCPALQTINGVTNVKGTVMSYCNQLGGCSASMVFHPRSLTEYINGALANANNVCVLPLNTAPTVAAITPKSGTTLGGTPVVVTGTNFKSGAKLFIGGIGATSVVVVGPTTITATTGPHPASGTVNLTVINPDASSGGLSNGYSYVAPTGSLAFFTLPPCRLVDTRSANGTLGGPSLSTEASNVSFSSNQTRACNSVVELATDGSGNVASGC